MSQEEVSDSSPDDADSASTEESDSPSENNEGGHLLDGYNKSYVRWFFNRETKIDIIGKKWTNDDLTEDEILWWSHPSFWVYLDEYVQGIVTIIMGIIVTGLLQFGLPILAESSSIVGSIHTELTSLSPVPLGVFGIPFILLGFYTFIYAQAHRMGRYYVITTHLLKDADEFLQSDPNVYPRENVQQLDPNYPNVLYKWILKYGTIEISTAGDDGVSAVWTGVKYPREVNSIASQYYDTKDN